MSTGYDAIVIGAGHNGLVAAAYLSRAGRRVLVLERRDTVGGVAVTEEFHPGFRADSGPHRIHGLHPGIVSELGLAEHGLRLERMDPSIVSLRVDGSHLALRSGTGASQDEIAKFSQGDAARWPEFQRQMARFAGFLAALYEEAPPRLPPGSRADLVELLRLGVHARRLGRTEMPELLRTIPMSAAELLDDWFETDVLKGALAGRAVTGLHQGPMAAGTAFHLLHGLAGSGESVGSTLVPAGGMSALGEAIAAAARASGAQIRTAAAVDRIAIKDGGVTGVVLSGGSEVRAPIVVSNADARHTLLDMVEPDALDPELRHELANIRYRGACARVQLALRERPVFRGLAADGSRLHGVIVVSPSIDYVERAYDDAKHGNVSRAPYLEAVIPSLRDPTFAPAGQHVMSVLVQYAPFSPATPGWDARLRDEVVNTTVDTLTEYAPNIGPAVVATSVIAPPDYERRFGLTGGDVHHGEMTLDQVLFMRPAPGWAAYEMPVTGLFLCGAGAHPGGGVTGMPGRNSARAVLSRYGASSWR